MKKTISTLSLILAALLSSSALLGCGETAADTPAGDTGNGQTGTIEPAETEPLYAYPEANYNGYAFRILNLDEFYQCYMRVDLEAQTGEAVDDAVYARNRRIEDRYNVTIREVNENFTGWSDGSKVGDALVESVLADDDSFDCAYHLVSFRPGVVTDGYLTDLYDIPELQLDEAWWDTYLNSALELNGKLYIATSPLQLTSLDLSWVMLFNKKMMTDQDIEYPYQAVRDGKWTIDMLNEYAAKLANLNGDADFNYSSEGNAVYGIAGHTTTPYLAILSTDNCLIQKDASGKQVYVGASDHLYDSLDKIKRAFNVSEGKIHYDAKDQLTDLGGYYNLFYYNRAAFLTTELKGTKVMRSMDADYGILPAPKYDEAQKNYITYASENIGRLCIPKTNDDLSRTGTLLDALSYESYRDVLPLYYNQTLSQKGLRDEDSIEMLDIINRGRMTEIGLIYGTNTSLINELKDMITKNADTAASIMAKYETKCQENLDKLLESVQ